MKRTRVIFGAVIITVGAVGLALWEGRGTSAPPVVVEVSSGVLGVDEFMHRPEVPAGQIRVQGVVSAVQAEAQLVTLIDRSEFDECAVVTCASLSLPVRWAGAMPQVEEGVEVTGRVREEAGKLIFVAEEMRQVSEAPGGAR